jgi:hypothetical protein
LRQAAILLIGLAALLGPLPSVASDDDEQPVYKIYIDPETGKYTTEDPLAADRDQPVPTAMPTESSNAASAAGAPRQNWYAAMAAALVMMLVLVSRRVLVRRRSSSH